MQIACSVCNERLGSERFTGSQTKKGRNGGQATCKDCQGDEGAAARAAQQQRELQSFLFAESDGALDGKKRSFKGVERRAAMPSAAIKNAAKAEFKLGGGAPPDSGTAQPTYICISIKIRLDSDICQIGSEVYLI